MLPLLLVTTAVLGSLQERRPVVQPPTLRLDGEVRDVDEEVDRPVGGRRLRLAFFLDGEEIDAHEVVTDREGGFRLQWTPPTRWMDAGEAVERGWTARVREVGLQQRGGIRRWSGPALLPAHDPALWIGPIDLRGGWSREVEVVDRAGERAVDVLLEVLPTTEGDPEPGLTEVEARSDWELPLVHAAAAVEALVVQATAVQGGAGWARIAREDPVPARIVLAGTGVLEGTLVDPLGEPIRGFALSAYHEALLPALLSEGIVPAGSAGSLAPHAGRVEAVALTDAQGRFRLEDLAAGRFFLQLPRWPGSERGARLEPTLQRVDGVPVRAVLPLHRLELDVPPGAEAFCVQLEPYPRSDFDAGALLERSQLLVSGAPAGRLTLKEGATYVAGLWSAARGLVQERVIAGSGGRYHQRPELRLPEAAGAGELELLVRCSRSSAPVQAQVLAPLSRHVLVDERLDTGSPGELRVRVLLPKGRYLVRAGEAEPSAFEPQPWTRFELVEAEQEIEVEAGGAASLELELTTGGRLALAVDAPGAERVVVRRRRPDEASWRLVEFEPRSSGIVVGRLSWILPGRRWTSRHPLAPGAHVLRVEAEGFAARTVELEVAPGQVSVELDVTLEPL